MKPLPQKPIRIIVAGEKSPALMQMSIILGRLGYLVRSAENGAEVLKFMDTDPADLVIFDGHLPAKDGFAALEQIKKHPEWAKTPLILMSESYSKTSEDEYIQFGYSGLLTKPIDLRKMNILVQAYLTTLKNKGRKHLRIPFIEKVALIHEKRRERYAALNLSEGGIYLGTAATLAVGTEVEMELPLKNARPLRLNGVVIYHRGSYADVFKVEPGMAVEFTDLSQSESKTLAAYITDMLMGDLQQSSQQIITAG